MALRQVTKQSSDKAKLEQLLAKQEKTIRDAFRAFLNTATSDETIKDIIRAIEDGDIERALSIIDASIARLGSVLPAVFVAAGTSSMEDISDKFKVGGVAIRFDPTNPRAAELMQKNRLEFVQEFTQKQRDATRQALTRGLETGAGPRQVARVFKDSIGLTATQEGAVANYRRLLEIGSKQSLDRGLRDRRFDRTVTRAIDNDVPLTTEQIDRMVDRYRSRYLDYRAETIARTEGVKTTSLARLEAMRQVVEEGGIDPERVIRVWNTTQDNRTRDAHVAMDGQEVGIDEPFVDGDGNELMYPGDPSAPIETTVNCFHPDTLIGVAGLKSAIKRRYIGDLIKLNIAGDIDLTVTPNHPILTERGWIPAGEVVEGDNLVNCVFSESILRARPDINYIDASAEKLYGLADLSTMYRPHSMIVNFHGEIPTHKVDIVAFPGKLRDAFYSMGQKCFANIGLQDADISQPFLFGQRLYRKLLVRPNRISCYLMAFREKLTLLFGSKLSESDLVGFAATPNGKFKIIKAVRDKTSGNPESVCHSADGITSVIHFKYLFVEFLSSFKTVLLKLLALNFVNKLIISPWQSKVVKAGGHLMLRDAEFFGDRGSRESISIEPLDFVKDYFAFFKPVVVVGVSRAHYEGPVYNFENDKGVIIASGIVTHNCRCTISMSLRKP